MKKKTLWIINSVTMGVMFISCVINAFIKSNEHFWFKITEAILAVIFAAFCVFWIVMICKKNEKGEEYE